MNRKHMIILGSVGVVLAVGTLVGVHYTRDMHDARERVSKGAQIAQTPCGPIQYADVGDGPPVLVIHGAGGGFDQGVLLGDSLLGSGYRIIAPSRFGYLSSPLAAGASIATQADAYACLLDHLGLESVAVAAISAGGPSGLEFAMRYPDRTEALIMVAAISWMDAVPSQAEEQHTSAINRLIGSDFVYWSTIHVARGPLLSLLGVSPELRRGLPAEEQQRIDEILTAMLPMGQRLPGILADQGYVFPRDMPLNTITAPTLVLHCEDDTLVSIEHGEHTASSIEGALFTRMRTGGHFLVGNEQTIQATVNDFLTQ